MFEGRNLIYQTKKQADSRSSPFYNPVDIDQDIRQELKQLRINNRAQQTEIFRLKGQVNQHREKILFYQEQLKVNGEAQTQEISKLVNEVSAIPMIIENKQLKEQLAHIHQINLGLNAKNRELQALNRQIESDLKRNKTKLKQLEILQSVRSQNFQKEVENAKPIIIEENKGFQTLSQCIGKIILFMREKVIQISYEVFQSSAKQCQNQKKTNSYNIFLNYWNELRKSKHLGYMALLQCLKSLNQVSEFLKYDKNQLFDINDSKYRDTLNQWIINTLTQIKYMNSSSSKMKEQKLFRLLGLLYRSRFPIKGQKYEMDEDVKKYFQDLLCQQIFLMLTSR